jgi:hypothetical protein
MGIPAPICSRVCELAHRHHLPGLPATSNAPRSRFDTTSSFRRRHACCVKQRLCPNHRMKLRLNDNVQWTHQAGGRVFVRSGVVVAVVAPGGQPDRVRFRSLYRGAETLPARDHDSYIVLVGDKTPYWPRVRLLRQDRSKTDGSEVARAERRWAATCTEQGWCSETQIAVLEHFIRERGLMPELAVFAANRARFEREVTLTIEAVA